ncbi:hypothetical protein F383_30711 [Gossypium arboreum]|uniref:Uncharacterized protein n=1 Tax=Gossypium arboreum TaxID=29729 RepID=A0A0B0MWN3_GOSAR|nr:hypothetical protein F383_30711 [Gossypium arboreum]
MFLSKLLGIIFMVLVLNV